MSRARSLSVAECEPAAGVGQRRVAARMIGPRKPAAVFARPRSTSAGALRQYVLHVLPVCRCEDDVHPLPIAVIALASLLVGGTWVGERGLTLSGGLGGSVFGYEVGGYGPRGPAVAAHSAAGWAF